MDSDIKSACVTLYQAHRHAKQRMQYQRYLVGLRIVIDFLIDAVQNEGAERAALVVLAAEALHDARLRADMPTIVLVNSADDFVFNNIRHTGLFLDMMSSYAELIWKRQMSLIRSDDDRPH